MSRSFKKPFVTISKAWDRFKERSFRHRMKKACQEIKFNPDKDYEELNYKKLKEWGTKLGLDLPPDENDDTWMHEEYERLRRK